MIITEYNKFINQQIDKKYLLKGVKKIKNKKPSKNFDIKYGTSLSQNYNFPFELTADEVFNIIWYDLEYNRKYEEESEKYKILIDSFTNEYFPYVDFNNINNLQKYYILNGMVSGFNYDDIIWFSIKEMFYFKNINVNKEIENFPNQIQKDIQWVISPKTLKKMKKQLNQNNFL